MKHKNIIMNFFYQGSYQLLVVLLPIITVPIVSRALQPVGVGTWNYVNSIVSYFTLIAGLGLSTYGVREIAYVRNDKKKLSQKFWEIEAFNIAFSSIVLLIYCVYAYFSSFSTLFFLQTMSVVATLLDISWLFQGIEDFKRVSLVNILVKIITFVLTVSLIREKGDLPLYVGIIGLSSLISGITFWFFLRGTVEKVSITWKNIWGHFRPALRFFIVKVSSTLFNNLNKTVLGIMTTMSVVGIFSNSVVLVMTITTLFNALNTVLLPRMSSLQQGHQERAMLSLLQKAINVQVFMTVGAMLITLGVIPELVSWFLGDSFSEVTRVVPILVPVMMFASIQQAIANMYLVPKDKIASYTKTIIIGTVINTVLCVSLIPFIGVFGAAIGYTLGQAYLAISRIYILTKETAFHFDYRYLMRCLLSGGVAYAAVILVGYLSISGFLLTALQGVVGILIYLLITALFGVNPVRKKSDA